MGEFDEAMKFVWAQEALSNNPPSTIFSTNPLTNVRVHAGIDQETYDRFRISRKISIRPVDTAPQSELEIIYAELFWGNVHLGIEKMPWPLNFMVFDTAIAFGIEATLEIMNRSVGLPASRSWGDTMTQRFLSPHANPLQISLRMLSTRFQNRVEQKKNDSGMRPKSTSFAKREIAVLSFIAEAL